MPEVIHNILTKTAEDSGHIDLSKAKWVSTQMSGPIPVYHTLRAGALFIFNAGLERRLVLSPVLQAIGFNPYIGGNYASVQIRFTEIPADLLEKFKNLDSYAPVFLVMKMEEKKKDEMMVGPARIWEQGYFIAGVVGLSSNEVIFAARRGTPIS